ncbi:hypothetical protein DPMN_155321 [Dreissena polymorpha]|uniref:Uncharacterized protein n=1 Tax=Dreissena polymorpha TaxID=45954 RepID=A0A9D4JAT0_DREPO|nr:hypothetical protein DPMN_155321 [Dreissena polymorpha]
MGNRSSSGSSSASGSGSSSSCGSSSSSNGGWQSNIKGGKWKNKLYFESTDKCGTIRHTLKDKDLTTDLKRLVGEDEMITYVTAYKVPLSEMQFTQNVFYHMFIVFETRKWFWSIEKQSDVITLQRKKNKDAVKNKCRRKKRNDGREFMNCDCGNISVHSLIDWLYKKDELDKPYHFLLRNCKHFARAVFNKVAKSEEV